MSESPDMMRAVSIREPGPPDVLQSITTERPVPGGRDVLIRVTAAGVNRPDVLQRLGKYPLPEGASPLPGLEVAGTVVAAGSAVRRWSAEALGEIGFTSTDTGTEADSFVDIVEIALAQHLEDDAVPVRDSARRALDRIRHLH